MPSSTGLPLLRSAGDIGQLNAALARDFAAGHGLADVRTAAAIKDRLQLELGFAVEE
ncbi:hypothetical protein V1525DRAFT_386966 [Lipomyces kononenkoae]|uniref:Uncharacterized protein n=1 Tax=Lipomyces kononenkoae TaxID=34357 RepID=A0ACC3T5D2_LIPKO